MRTGDRFMPMDPIEPALVVAFRAHASAELAACTDEDVGAAIAAWIAAGRAAWPGVAVDEAAFVAHVTARTSDLTAVHAADLWLACACAHGDTAACALFDARYLAPLGPVLAGTGLAADQIDDVKQELRRKLLV